MHKDERKTATFSALESSTFTLSALRVNIANDPTCVGFTRHAALKAFGDPRTLNSMGVYFSFFGVVLPL